MRSASPGSAHLRGVAGLLSIAAVLASCATSSRVLIGMPRPMRAPSEVQILFEPPHRSYDTIAVLAASSRWSFALSGGGQEDVVLERLRREAAKVGADAVLMQELSDQPLEPVGAGVGALRESSRGTVELGVQGMLERSRKFGRGLAISLQSTPNAPR
jgi:hypothetical protein